MIRLSGEVHLARQRRTDVCTSQQSSSGILQSNPVRTVTISYNERKEYFITARTSEDNFEKVCDELRLQMEASQARIAFQYIFGCISSNKKLSFMTDPDWPLTVLRGNGCSGRDINNTQVIAIAGPEMTPLVDNDQIAGYCYETEDARFCLLGNIGPRDLSMQRAVQARFVFEKMERLLGQADMDMSDTVRTWIYLEDLLAWYDTFNAVRTQFFRERGIFSKMLPASTGIGASLFSGGAMVCALLAIKPKDDRVKILPVPPPLQCPAGQYKSSFNRAVEVERPGSRTLIISGTASIDTDWNTIHANNPARQIDRTMEVVHAILRSREMDWKDTTRAIAYFKDMKHLPLFERYCQEHNMADLPVAIAHGDICREELLFELELDAVIKRD
jgi:enamine deaminase RidA (YjgF/YER057c/UK114 family)